MRAPVRSMADVIAFRNDVRRALERDPLDPVARDEVLLALTELGTNVVLHSEGGELSVDTRGGSAIRLESANGVPPALRCPGASPAGLPRGLGLGLASLRRIMDRVETRLDGDRFVVTCEKDLDRGRRARP